GDGGRTDATTRGGPNGVVSERQREVFMSESAPQTGVRAPVGVDTSRASIARVYDASLGGKDNYDVDRAALGQILEVAPRQGDVSLMNRRWLHRVTRYLAGTVGIDQFLDIGAGLPTVGNTHEIAQQQ